MPNSLKKTNVMLRTLRGEMRAAIKNPDFDPQLPKPLLCIYTLKEAQPENGNAPSIVVALKQGKQVKCFTISCHDLSGQSQRLRELVWNQPTLSEYKSPSGIRRFQQIATDNSQKPALRLPEEGFHKVCRKSKVVAEILVVADRDYLISGSCPMAVHIENPSVTTEIATPDEWNDEIGKHLQGNPRMQLVVFAALAPVLAALFGWSPPAIVLAGTSSTGKSTLLRIAQSVYSTKTTIPTMSGTSLGLREAATKANGRLVIFDEVSSADNPSVLISLLFDAEGQSQRHLATAGSAANWKPTNTLTTLLFANEFGVAQLLGKHDRSGTLGTWARVIEVLPSSKHGMFDVVPKELQPHEFAEALKNSAARCGGALWHPWLEYIGTNAMASRTRWKERHDAIVKQMREELEPRDSIQQRLIQSTAIWVLTGELAVDAGLLTLKRETALRAVKYLLRLHFKRMSPGAESQSLIRAVVKAVGKLRNKIKNWPVAGGDPMPHHARKHAYGSMCLFILPIDLDNALGSGEKCTNTLKALLEAGLLKRPQKTWATQVNWPGNKSSKPRFYVFDEKILSLE